MGGVFNAIFSLSSMLLCRFAAYLRFQYKPSFLSSENCIFLKSDAAFLLYHANSCLNRPAMPWKAGWKAGTPCSIKMPYCTGRPDRV